MQEMNKTASAKHNLVVAPTTMRKRPACIIICILSFMLYTNMMSVGLHAQASGIIKPLVQNEHGAAPQINSVTAGNGIIYHGGPVMLGPHNVYLIWYGNWGGNTATDILPSFISGLDGSAYFTTNTTYGTTTGNIVNSVFLAGQVNDGYSQGTTVSDQGVQTVISAQLQSGALPADPNGIYFVLTTPEVIQTNSSISGQFCVDYCGYHSHANLNGTDIKYAFVGNPALQCPSGRPVSCSAQKATPNGNEGADAMANVMAHELNETVTDPDLNSWFDSNGQEVGDKCNFMFGATFPLFPAGVANITLGKRNYLIQQNWVNSANVGCNMSFGTGPTIVVNPAAAGRHPGQQLTINANQNVNWSISGILPPNAPFGPGTLSTSGPSSSVLYTQPPFCSSQISGLGLKCTVTVTATDPNNPNNKVSTLIDLIPPPIILQGVSPSSGTGISGTFRASVVIENAMGIGSINDSGTGREITLMFAPAGTMHGTASVCEVFYLAANNLLLLQNDAATHAISAPLGSAGTLSNSQCSIDVQRSSASISGSTLTLTVPVTFSASFGGLLTIYEQGWNGQFFEGFSPVGNWSVPLI